MAAPKIGSPTGFRSIETWDLIRGVLEWRLWALLGLQDIRQRYRRSMLGPLWLTLGLGVTVLGIGLLYTKIMRSSASNFVPWVAISFLIWTFIQSVLSEASALFSGAQAIITSVRIPYTSFVLRLITRNLIVAAHGVLVVILAFLWYRFSITPMAIVSLLGLVILCANLYWMAMAIALLSARYRDMAQMITYGIGIAFFMTPVVWLPSTVRPNSPYLVWNPLNHLIAVVRSPIYYHTFPLDSFIFDVVMLIVGTSASIFFFFRVRRYLVYWV